MTRTVTRIRVRWDRVLALVAAGAITAAFLTWAFILVTQ